MEAILFIGHGSRLSKASEEAANFINKCMRNNNANIQEYGFLELSEPTIEEAFERCVSRGAKTVKVIPVLLLTAAHAKKDIPEKLAEMKAKFPYVKILYGRPIGVHPGMVEILKERINESGKTLAKDSLVLLVGRGSSDLDVKNDLGKIAEMLERKLESVWVKDCYLTGNGPHFEEELELSKTSSATTIFIIPYLLFTGILMNSLGKAINRAARETNKSFILCNYLGYHPSIQLIMEERLMELAE